MCIRDRLLSLFFYFLKITLHLSTRQFSYLLFLRFYASSLVLCAYLLSFVHLRVHVSWFSFSIFLQSTSNQPFNFLSSFSPKHFTRVLRLLLSPTFYQFPDTHGYRHSSFPQFASLLMSFFKVWFLCLLFPLLYYPTCLLYTSRCV